MLSLRDETLYLAILPLIVGHQVHVFHMDLSVAEVIPAELLILRLQSACLLLQLACLLLQLIHELLVLLRQSLA